MSSGGGWGSDLARALVDSWVAKYDPENHDPAYATAHAKWANLVASIERLSRWLGEGTTGFLDLPTTSIGAPACWTRQDSRPTDQDMYVEMPVKMVEMWAGWAESSWSDLFDNGVVRPEFTAGLLGRPHLESLRSRYGQAHAELDNSRLWLEAVTAAGGQADVQTRLHQHAGVWTARAAAAVSALDAALSTLDAVASTAAGTLTEGEPQTLPQQLAQLARLHDVGALTDEEFAQAKSQVLGGRAQP